MIDIFNWRDRTFVNFPIILVSAKNRPDQRKFSKRRKCLSSDYLVLQMFADTSIIDLSLLIEED